MMIGSGNDDIPGFKGLAQTIKSWPAKLGQFIQE